MNTANRINHIGRNICRIRELRGMKQDALAYSIGVSQQTISNIEKSEVVEIEKINSIAAALTVDVSIIQNFDEECLLNSNKENNTGHTENRKNIYLDFNLYMKLFESQEENKKLYERLLQSEKEKFRYVEQMLTSLRNLNL